VEYGDLRVSFFRKQPITDRMWMNKRVPAGYLPPLQRLGWLLDHTGWQKLTGNLHAALQPRKPQWRRLEPQLTEQGQRNEQWRIIENMDQKMTHPDFIHDSDDLLRPGVSFNRAAAYAMLDRDLLSLL
jgi:hypothetical protein